MVRGFHWSAGKPTSPPPIGGSLCKVEPSDRRVRSALRAHRSKGSRVPLTSARYLRHICRFSGLPVVSRQGRHICTYSGRRSPCRVYICRHVAASLGPWTGSTRVNLWPVGVRCMEGVRRSPWGRAVASLHEREAGPVRDRFTH